MFKNSAVVGALDLYADSVEYFDPAGMELLEEMAADITFALGTFERERQRREAEAILEGMAERQAA